MDDSIDAAPTATGSTERGERRPWWRHPAAVVGTAFVVGGIPFANLAARWRAGVDLRDVGTGTVSGSGLYHVAGFGPLALAGMAEVGKGAVGPWLAGDDRPVLGALAGGAAVCGHNWSPFLRGAGGRGLSPAMGALAVRHPLGTAILLSGLAVGWPTQQQGFCSFGAMAALVPVLTRQHGRDGAVAATAVLAPMLVKRVLGNDPARRVTSSTRLARLLLDHDRWSGAPGFLRRFETGRAACGPVHERMGTG